MDIIKFESFVTDGLPCKAISMTKYIEDINDISNFKEIDLYEISNFLNENYPDIFYHIMTKEIFNDFLKANIVYGTRICNFFHLFNEKNCLLIKFNSNKYSNVRKKMIITKNSDDYFFLTVLDGYLDQCYACDDIEGLLICLEGCISDYHKKNITNERKK